MPIDEPKTPFEPSKEDQKAAGVNMDELREKLTNLSSASKKKEVFALISSTAVAAIGCSAILETILCSDLIFSTADARNV